MQTSYKHHAPRAKALRSSKPSITPRRGGFAFAAVARAGGRPCRELPAHDAYPLLLYVRQGFILSTLIQYSMRIFEEGLQVGRYPFSIMAKLEKPCLSAPASFFSMFLLSVTRNMRIEIEATAAEPSLYLKSEHE